MWLKHWQDEFLLSSSRNHIIVSSLLVTFMYMYMYCVYVGFRSTCCTAKCTNFSTNTSVTSLTAETKTSQTSSTNTDYRQGCSTFFSECGSREAGSQESETDLPGAHCRVFESSRGSCRLACLQVSEGMQ